MSLRASTPSFRSQFRPRGGGVVPMGSPVEPIRLGQVGIHNLTEDLLSQRRVLVGAPRDQLDGPAEPLGRRDIAPHGCIFPFREQADSYHLCRLPERVHIDTILQVGHQGVQRTSHSARVDGCPIGFTECTEPRGTDRLVGS